MLGSWSLGDYDGPQSQRWGLELLCDGFGLSRELLYATVFGGDGQVGPDSQAQQAWGELEKDMPGRTARWCSMSGCGN